MSAASQSGYIAHPDSDLLALCARLAEMQAEWQRLWEPTRDDWRLDDPPITEADHAWLRFNDYVWPGINLVCQWRGPPGSRHPDDVLGRLHDIPATTPEGLRAKAAAILAAEDAGCYGADLRDDASQLIESVLKDVAGPARCLMGEDRK